MIGGNRPENVTASGGARMKETAYLLQAALISVWWVGLASSQAFFAAFQFAGVGPTAFWSFLLPDLILIAGLSLARAYRENATLEYIILGAMGYGALYCCNATLLTGSGLLPTGLMLLGFAYNGFLCFHASLFRPASTDLFWNVLKTAIQFVSIWVLTLLVIPYVLLDAFGQSIIPRIDAWFYLGVFLFVCCGGLGLASSYFIVFDGVGTPLPLDQTNRLVTTGPYRYVRNPMAVAGIGQGMAIAMIYRSPPILVYSLLGMLIWHIVVRPIEERDMLKRFGLPYAEYRSRVSCWIPTFGRIPEQ
uniref:Protein-S-isoprenylcysteine O-methyltransferase n=2 Tax=Rubinisphaera brasiliensis TaxID=119 RepID=F0SG32_RUBBR|nr:protein-S-isoprenylcysteine O-methyltransferase [Rubinisphaera brasiliensis DSM 5305]